MSVTNGFGPATFPIKFGPGFTDDLLSGKQFFVYLGRTGSSSPVAGELHEPSFNRVKFVQHQSISAAAPAILCPTPFRPKYFRALHLCVENIFILIANCMTDLLFLVGKNWVLVGNRWAILWLFTLKHLADTGVRCSSAAWVQVVRIHKRCV
jgi:hypothetical protein